MTTMMMVTSKPMIPAGTLYSVQSLTELTEMLQERPAYCVRGSDPLAEMLRRSFVGPKPLYQKRSFLRQPQTLALRMCRRFGFFSESYIHTPAYLRGTEAYTDA